MNPLALLPTILLGALSVFAYGGDMESRPSSNGQEQLYAESGGAGVSPSSWQAAMAPILNQPDSCTAEAPITELNWCVDTCLQECDAFFFACLGSCTNLLCEAACEVLAGDCYYYCLERCSIQA